jgi:F0F1-type ATP synthase assembly protein I
MVWPWRCSRRLERGWCGWDEPAPYLAVGKDAVYNATVARMSTDPQRDLAQAGSLGFTLVAAVLVFTGAGYLLDRWFHTRPWLMVAGVFVGFALGFTYMVLVMFADSSSARKRKKGGNGDGGSDGRLM